MAGKYIVIEGTDSSGKETQSKLLSKRLLEEGYKCITVSFPNYDSPTGKIVSEYLGKNNDGLFPEGAVNVDPKIASLYYAADRKYNIDQVIKYYNEGYYIILDRYTTSNLAHQGSKLLSSDDRFEMYQWIDKLEYWLLGLPKPDNTIFLHVPVEYSLELLKKEKKDLDEHEKNKDYLKRCEASYIELSELYHWDTIECVKDGNMRSIEDINDEIFNIIKKQDS